MLAKVVLVMKTLRRNLKVTIKFVEGFSLFGTQWAKP